MHRYQQCPECGGAVNAEHYATAYPVDRPCVVRFLYCDFCDTGFEVTNYCGEHPRVETRVFRSDKPRNMRGFFKRLAEARAPVTKGAA